MYTQAEAEAHGRVCNFWTKVYTEGLFLSNTKHVSMPL